MKRNDRPMTRLYSHINIHQWLLYTVGIGTVLLLYQYNEFIENSDISYQRAQNQKIWNGLILNRKVNFALLNYSQPQEKFEHCEKQKALAFVKTHKCASDTLAAHFMRLADEWESETILPRGIWNVGWPGPRYDFHASQKSSRRFDIQVRCPTKIHITRKFVQAKKIYKICRAYFAQF